MNVLQGNQRQSVVLLAAAIIYAGVNGPNSFEAAVAAAEALLDVMVDLEIKRAKEAVRA